MVDPKKKRYIYAMLAGFGAIGFSVILFFLIYNFSSIGAWMHQLSDIMAPFIYGGIVAYLLRPMCNIFEDFLAARLPKKVKHYATGLAILFSMFVLLIIVYALINMIVPRLIESVVNLWNTIPGRVQTFVGWVESTFGERDMLVEFFNTGFATLYADMSNWAANSPLSQLSSIMSGVGLQFSSIVSGVGTSVYKVLRVVYNMIIGCIVAVYLLSGRKRFARQGILLVRGMLPERWADLVLREIKFVDKMFGGFIDAKILDSAIIGLLCYIGCSVFRFPNALLVSVFVGVTNVIPFFGPFIGAVPSTFLILIENPIKALWFILFVLVLQQIDGNIIGPKIMGNRTGLSGFWVLFAIVLFGGLWGVFGMVVCVPVFAVFYDTVKKLVKRGLNNKGKIELWEEYIADFPNDDLPLKD